MRIGLLFFIILCLSLPGCWRDGSNQDFFIPASDPVTCTVTFDFTSITLPSATEGLAYADLNTLFNATAGGVPPYLYSEVGTGFDLASLSVESDGDVVSGVGGAGPVGFYQTTVTVTDSTGVCTDIIPVSITIISAVPVILPPRILSVNYPHGGVLGTDTVAGSALAGSIPDFFGIQPNTNSGAADRVFNIDIDSDSDLLLGTTVNATNVTVEDVNSFPVAGYTVVYDPVLDRIVVTIPGGVGGAILANGATHVVTVGVGVTNTSGDPFVAPNTFEFLTAADWATNLFTTITSSGAGSATCTSCHQGGAPLFGSSGTAVVDGGIADPPGAPPATGLLLDFRSATGFAGVLLTLQRANPPGRTYISLGGVAGVGVLDPNSAVLAKKLSTDQTFGFGVRMPDFGADLDASAAVLTGGSSDPDTSAPVTGTRFVDQVRSWIRAGAPSLLD